MFSRRFFLKMTAAVAVPSSKALWATPVAASSVDELVKAAKQAGQDEIVIAIGGGTYFEVLKELFFDPFTEETGITVTAVGGNYSERVARLQAMMQADAIEWDIMASTYDAIATPRVAGLLADLGDCSELSNVVRYGLEGSCRGKGVLWDSGGLVLAYDESAFPDAAPQNWADFWNVDRFPGPRALPNYGTPWYVLAAALLADGVSADKVYPMDVDRAFEKLEQLRPHVSAWWTSGDHSQQLFRTKEVVASMVWNGRAAKLREEGLPISFVWKGAMFEAAALGVVKGAPNAMAAKALLNYLYARPEAHAEFADRLHYALPNKNAGKHMDAALAKTLVSAPENWSKTVMTDSSWLAENREALITRWTAWLSG